MEVSSSFVRIEKFNKRLRTISLKEFKATFSAVVCELGLKYSVNYIEALHSKHWPIMCTLKLWMRMSNIVRGFWETQIPNPTYATVITTAF
jgi:hypothetical protein